MEKWKIDVGEFLNPSNKPPMMGELTAKKRLVVRPLPIEKPTKNTRLKAKLAKMGFAKLLDFPWSFTSLSMVEEMKLYVGGTWMVREKKLSWSPPTLAKVYGLEGMLGKGDLLSSIGSNTNNALTMYFESTNIFEMEGHVVGSCKDPVFKKILAFLVPVFNPLKPT